MERKLTRRDLGKGLAAGAVAGVIDVPGMAAAQISRDAVWQPVAPGIWRATFGNAEAVTL